MTNNENISLLKQAINYLNNKEYTLTIVAFTKALQKDDYDSKIHYYLAICYSNLKYYKEALEEIELAFKEDIEYVVKLQLLLLKGYINFILENDDIALQTFQQVTEFEKNNKIALSGIGYYYFKKNDYKKALEYYELAYKTAPENSNAMNNYGYLLMMNNQSIEKAMELCNQALKKQPNNPNILDSVAWGHYLLNNIKAATLAITKAINFGGAIDEIKNHYSEISKKVRELLSSKK